MAEPKVDIQAVLKRQAKILTVEKAIHAAELHEAVEAMGRRKGWKRWRSPR